MASKRKEKEPLLRKSFIKPEADSKYGSASKNDDVIIDRSGQTQVRMLRHITLPYAVGE